MNRAYANACKYTFRADKTSQQAYEAKVAPAIALVKRWQQLHGHSAKVIK